MMHYIIIKSRLFSRWRVYEMGHLEGDRMWLATFRNAQDAAAWIGEPHTFDRAADGNSYRYHATGLPAGGDALPLADRGSA